MDYNKIVGESLEEVIKQKDLTLNRLAQKTGFTPSYLSKIVSGKMPKLPVNTLQQIVGALDYSMSDFMGLVDKKKSITSVDMTIEDFKWQFCSPDLS